MDPTTPPRRTRPTGTAAVRLSDVATEPDRERWLQVTPQGTVPATVPATGPTRAFPTWGEDFFIGRDITPAPRTGQDLRGGYDAVIVHVRPDTAGEEETGHRGDSRVVEVEVFAVSNGGAVTLVGRWPRIDATWPQVIAPTVAYAYASRLIV